jgi:MFS family permease
MTRIVSSLILFTFFASGCSALIYQITWQRYLFIGLGVDIDSVTLIVSTFMLGIGAGGALGGWLADRQPTNRLAIYALAELGLAIIGVLSPVLFHAIQMMGGWGWPYYSVSTIAVAVVLIPTTIMGATLPVLTMHFDEALSNVGVSVGMLYFFNTLGAAFGAWVTANVLFMHWGLDFSVRLAAFVNLCCFVFAIAAVFFSKNYSSENSKIGVAQ